MRSLNLLTAAWCLFAYTAEAQTKLNITAIGTQSGSSRVECWQLGDAYSMTVKPDLFNLLAGDLGNVANASYLLGRPGVDIGLHNAPYKQWIFVISGLLHVTVPDDNTAFFATAGKSGILFASDTSGVSTRGHGTDFRNADTIVVTVPTRDNQVPAHTILHAGPCTKAENFGQFDLTG